MTFITCRFLRRERWQSGYMRLQCRFRLGPFSSATSRYLVLRNSESFRKDPLALRSRFHEPRVRDRLGSIILFVVTKREREIGSFPEEKQESCEPMGSRDNSLVSRIKNPSHDSGVNPANPREIGGEPEFRKIKQVWIPASAGMTNSDSRVCQRTLVLRH